MARRTLALVAVVVCVSSLAGAQVLYDGSAGGTPDAQGWLYRTLPLGGASALNGAAGGVTTLDTTAVRTDYAGWFSEFLPSGRHPLMPALDRAAGYVVRFDLQVLAEGHDVRDIDGDLVDDRAGFSVIALSSDGQGIELGFWADEVWAYDYRTVGAGEEFIHDETSVGFRPDAAMTRYELWVTGPAYTLKAGGAAVLSGALRDYSGGGEPYTTPSFLFFGDDSGSADSRAALSYIDVIPEPASLCLLAAGAAALLRRRRR